jgi:predicted amidohydrolase
MSPSPSKNRIRVASAQYWIRPIRDFDQFVDQVMAVIETAEGYESRLLVMPEYFTIQLVSLGDVKRPIDEQVRDVAKFYPRYLELMSEMAKKTKLYIVAGSMPVYDEKQGKVYNDAHLFAPDGSHDTQGKLHMTRFEREDWKVSERSQLKIFETDFGRMAIAVCYDVEFPELSRAIAHEDVHILAVPSSTDDRHGFLRVRYCSHARAIENQMYVVHSPTVGSLPRVPDVSLNYGQASIMTPCDFPFARDGILSEGVLNQEGMIIGELDMDTIEESRSFGTVLPLQDSRWTKQLTEHIQFVKL